jgi:hypothetical protein
MMKVIATMMKVIATMMKVIPETCCVH